MILFMDGFDHYNVVGQKWSYISNGGGYAIGPTGRFGGNKGALAGGVLINKYGLPNSATLYAGRGYYSDTLSSASVILGFLDGGALQVEVRETDNGGLAVARNGTVLGSTAGNIVSRNTWNHVAFKATIHPSAGAADVYFNGVLVLSLTGLNTRATANSYANGLSIVCGAGTTWIDDVYVGDTTGSAPNNDLLGDCRVSTLYPTGAGAHADFTHSTGSTNWGVVDETPPNTTDYNYSATAGNIDTFSHGSLPASAGAVYAVQSCLYATKDDAGAKALAPALRHAGADAAGADYALPSSYGYGFQIFPTNPANGDAAWTAADVNADEFGYKVNEVTV